MCDLNKMLIVAHHFFENDRIILSIGTKHQHTMDQTLLIDGRIAFNSYEHRRDAFDVMIKFNLYVKKLENGQYESGSHDSLIKETYIADKPIIAITEMAYIICKKEGEKNESK